MVTGYRADPGRLAGIGELMLRIDGSRALTAESVAELGALCNRAEDSDANRPGLVVL
jgi:hypothetical protein